MANFTLDGCQCGLKAVVHAGGLRRFTLLGSFLVLLNSCCVASPANDEDAEISTS
jgi:hypothetical protein